jgi:hypothetical protein
LHVGIENGTKGGSNMMHLGGLIGLLIFIGDIWAVVVTIQSRTTTLAKVVWILVIFFLPLLGLIIWFFVGPRR